MERGKKGDAGLKKKETSPHSSIVRMGGEKK